MSLRTFADRIDMVALAEGLVNSDTNLIGNCNERASRYSYAADSRRYGLL